MKLRLRWIVVVFAWVAGILVSQDIFAQDDFPTQPEQTSSSIIKSVKLFPNPAVEYVHVRIENMDVAQVTFQLHNIIGNVVNVESEVVDQHELRLRVKDLPIGYYLVSITDVQTRVNGTFKFVKR